GRDSVAATVREPGAVRRLTRLGAGAHSLCYWRVPLPVALGDLIGHGSRRLRRRSPGAIPSPQPSANPLGRRLVTAAATAAPGVAAGPVPARPATGPGPAGHGPGRRTDGSRPRGQWRRGIRRSPRRRTRPPPRRYAATPRAAPPAQRVPRRAGRANAARG